ncbi:unnamed protein product [Meganyctiphanes norvegica]|uniref:Major facilitator superfamily (MFS) profile domain-containing protein n=1 Tax=Meganyctiphanes norvegica TaxID=48144 RepID=A0AAV2Q7C4_MEGNR
MDDAINNLGLGKWQVLPIATFLFIHSSYPTQFIAAVFTNMPIDYQCVEPLAQNDIINSFDNKCTIGNYSYANKTFNTENNDTYLEKCNNFNYDTSKFKSTFTSEFNLVCDQQWLSPLYKLSAFSGVIIGSLFTGLSDRWGRVIIIRTGIVIYAINVVVIGLVPNMIIIFVARFIIGFCYEVLNASSFALMMEVLPTKWRSTVGAVSTNLSNTMSTIITGIVSYFVRDWRTLHLILSFPIYVAAILAIFLDKSPRWLVQKGKINEGVSVLQKASRINRKINPNDEEFSSYQYIIDLNKMDGTSQDHEITQNKSFCNVVQSIFCKSAVCKIFIVMPLVWFFTAIVYWSLPLNANNFTTNPYLYIVMIGLADIPPNAIGPILIKKFGNINTGTLMYIIASVCLLGVIIIPEQVWWLKWIIVPVSMSMISVNYMVCYIMSSELYPTVLRTIGFGTGSFIKHCGILLASYITDLASERGIKWLTNSISIGCCLFALILARFLPETHRLPLCDTILDVEQRQLRIKNRKTDETES